MNKILELIEEAKERTGCMVIKEDKLYRIKGGEYAISEFIGWIETDGYIVYMHEGPETEEETLFYMCLVEIAKDK